MGTEGMLPVRRHSLHHAAVAVTTGGCVEEESVESALVLLRPWKHTDSLDEFVNELSDAFDGRDSVSMPELYK